MMKLHTVGTPGEPAMPEIMQLHADSEQTTLQYYVASPGQLSNNPFVTPPDALFYRQISVEYCQRKNYSTLFQLHILLPQL